MKYEPETFILTINSGSSSLKFALFNATTLAPELTGAVSMAAPGVAGHFKVIDNDGEVIINQTIKSLKLTNAEKEIITFLQHNRQKYPVTAIGHRIVQGGQSHRQPEAVSPELVNELQQMVYLAPNHLPGEIALLKTFGAAFPDAVQVACFDTFFHRGMPDYASTYALPVEYREKGLMRYGFHGLSYEYVLEHLKAKYSNIKNKKIIIAHLGSGASLAAVKNGIGIDTTMGISPIGGLVMSTRAGDLDPGAILFMLNQQKLSVQQLDEVLSRASGLTAIAGTGDMAALLQQEPTSAEAKLAVDMFCYNAKKYIGAMAAALGGLDTLVFTGGIGENAPLIRKQICRGLGFLGIELNGKKNNHNYGLISKKQSGVKVKVILADEASIIAKHTCKLINQLHKKN